MFTIAVSDSLARLAELETKHGSLITPAVFPVHDLGGDGGWNTPRYWEEYPHINTAMFNASILSMNKRGCLGATLHVGVHRFIRFFGVAFVDSGGFIYRKYKLTIRPDKILEIQEKIGADIASTLDYPIECKAITENTNITKTISNAKLAASLKKDERMLLFASVNGYDPAVLRNAIRHLQKQSRFDGFAIGSLMPRFSNYRLLVDLIFAAKLEAKETPIHVYGLGGPLVTPLLIYLGVDSFDSSFFIKASAKRNYAVPGYGRVSFHDLKKLDSLPCQCPVCQKHSIEELRKSRKLLTFHNLSTLWNEIEQVKTAIRERRTEEYLFSRFGKAKWAKKAFEYAKKRIRFRFPGA